MIYLDRDNYGYSQGEWNPIAAEHNDALRAFHLSGNGVERLEDAEIELKKLRRQIEDRLRKDRQFLYKVASLI